MAIRRAVGAARGAHSPMSTPNVCSRTVRGVPRWAGVLPIDRAHPRRPGYALADPPRRCRRRASGARAEPRSHACIYESYHGSDASRLIYFVTHDFLPVTKPQGATKARLAPKGGSLTGERVRACGCDRGGSSCRLAPPPGPSSGASRHRSMVEIWVSASCLSAWAYADAAPRKLGDHPLCATPRESPLPGHGHGG